MGFVLGLIIGLGVGAAALYWMQQQKIKEKEDALQQSRRQIEQLETEREQRLREATQKLQDDYQAQLERDRDRLIQEATQTLQDNYRNQLEQQTQTLDQRYQSRIQELETRIQQLEADLQTARAEAAAPSVDAPQTYISPEPIRLSVTKPASDFTGPAVQTPEPPSGPDVTPEPELIVQPFSVQPSEPDPSEPEAPAVTPEPEPTAPAAPQPVQPQSFSLSEQVTTLGQLGEITSIPLLIPFCYQPDHQVRQQTAIALGQAVTGSTRPEVQRAIQALGTLSRDPDAAVRLAAVEALGTIRSDKVIPFLRRAQRDADLNVVEAASVAIHRFKFYPAKKGQPKKAKSKPKR